MKTIVTDTEIKGFFDENRFLSNFEPCHIEYDGDVYCSSEAAYQAAKTLDKQVRKKFKEITASASKKLGRKTPLREDWDKVKNEVMFDILVYKFTKNKELREKLLSTGDKYLEETNWWNDTYWGVCNGVGENMLGKTLIKIREGIKDGSIF